MADADVLVYNAPPTGINPLPTHTAAAINVLGATNSAGATDSCTQSGISLTEDAEYQTTQISYDLATARLFVPDSVNNRVLVFDGTCLPTVDYFIP